MSVVPGPFCDKIDLTGRMEEANIYHENHLDYICRLTGSLCVGRTVIESSRTTSYSREMAERCPTYSLYGVEKYAEKKVTADETMDDERDAHVEGFF